MALVTSWWVLDLLVLFGTLIAAIYAYFRHIYQHWKSRGFPQPMEPVFPSGNFAGVAQEKPIDLILADIYKQNPKERFVGCYLISRPILIIRDLELAKAILVKDFSHFVDRGLVVNLKKDPLSAHLFLLNGQEWRNVRAKLTPTFTSGKIKTMFSTLMDVGKQLVDVLEEASKEEETEVKDILSRYTIDVISSVAFGIEANSLKNPDNELRKLSIEMSHLSTKQKLFNVLVFTSPAICKRFPMKLMPQNQEDFFMNMVKETMKYREENNVQRNDFMQLLIQLKDLGYVKDADNTDVNPENQQKFTIEEAASQAFLFFFAGFETSSSTMQFALYELALNQELQKQAQEELDHAIGKNNGQLTYDLIMHLDLLDRIVNETLRKYPVAGLLLRECTKEYQIPDSDLKLRKGDHIWFPIHGYHRDPEYYPEPEKFDPDRFLPEVKESRHHYAYMPFGEGPRNCIGNRFGLVQTKVGLALVLSNFNVTRSKKTPVPIEFDPKTNILSPKGNMPVKISKRK